MAYDPAEYQARLNAYLEAMGVTPAPTYQTPATEQYAVQQSFPASLPANLAAMYLAGGGGATAAAALPTSSAVPVASHLSGGTLLSSGEIAPFSSGAATGVAPTSITNFAGGATPYLGGAGAALGAYGMYDAYKKKSPLLGALSGAGAGTGLAMMGAGPVGWLAGGGLALGALAGALGKKPQTEVEDKRFRALQSAGLIPRDAVFRATKDPHAWYRKDLAPDYIGETPGKEWVNNKFAMSRDEADLRPNDIIGYSTFLEKFGNKWNEVAPDLRTKIAQAVLDAKAADEHHGTIDVDWSKAGLMERVNSYFGRQGVMNKPLITPATPTRSMTKSPGISKDGKRIYYSAKKK